jgi:hypothetical protein
MSKKTDLTTLKTDLKTLIPDQAFDTSAGEITLRPFEFQYTNRALDIISKYASILVTPKKVEYLEDGKLKEYFVPKESVDIVNEVLKKTGDDNYSVLEDIAKILALSSSDDIAEKLPSLRYTEVIYLFSVVVTLNKDFFSEIQSLFTVPEEKAKEEKALTGETGSAV